MAALHKERYAHLVRQASYGGTSDSDGVHSNGVSHFFQMSESIETTKSIQGSDYHSGVNGKTLRSQSTRSSLSNGGILPASIDAYPILPFTQLHLALTIDSTKNTLVAHLTHLEHIAVHPVFHDQAEYFIRVQLLNNKLLKKFHDMSRKRRSTVPWSTWEKQPEQTTKFVMEKQSIMLFCFIF